MTVRHVAAVPADDQAEPLTVDDAYARSHRAALTAVGDRRRRARDRDPPRRPGLGGRPGALGPGRPDARRSVCAAAGRSAVTLEPGGQFELSGPPAPDILTAVTELRRDDCGARQALAELRLGVAHGGRRPAPAVPADQPEAQVPGDGAALRGHRPRRVRQGDDELDRRHAGQPAGRAGTRLAGAGSARVPARADAGGHLRELALAVRARHRVEVGAAAGLGGL